MIDKATRNRLKAKAKRIVGYMCNRWRKSLQIAMTICSNSGEFNCGECFIIARLVDYILTIKQGIIDKTDGAKQQSEIFKVIELEE